MDSHRDLLGNRSGGINTSIMKNTKPKDKVVSVTFNGKETKWSSFSGKVFIQIARSKK